VSEFAAAFNQINLIVEDMDATLAFYRRLGLEINVEPGDWPPGSGARHAGTTMPNGAQLEFDNAAMARIWHGGFDATPRVRGGLVLGFALPTRQAVDSLYASLTDSGAAGRQEPHDAFWGARFAMLQDPDGNDVGLMSPIDRERGYTPEVKGR
jgi:catechol 2,3-dioxygenase-like lactoylglutathione lyase family enzyme